MARKFGTAIDLVKNELQNAVIQNLAGAPSSPVKGQLYFNSTDNVLYWWDGAAWVAAKAPASSGIDQATADARYVNITGDAMTGDLIVPLVNTARLHDTTPGGDLRLMTNSSTRISIDDASIVASIPVYLPSANPTSAQQAAHKSYVDNMAAGLAWKDSVRIASTANLGLTGLTAVDGVTPIAGDRVLVKNQTAAAANGIYVAAAGAWARATDADSETDLVNATVFVSEGSQADTAWVMTTNAPITVGTTTLAWVQFGAGTAYTAGAGLTLAGNSFDVGQGTGILVAADSVAVDTSTIATVASLTGKADKTTVHTAGAGLTGGGDLSANRTFDVGAGTGITVAADAVALDTTYTDARYALAASGTKRFAQDVGGATAVTVAHNLGTSDVIVQVYRKATPFDQIECDVEHTSTTAVTLRFSVAPAAAEYRAVVLA